MEEYIKIKRILDGAKTQHDAIRIMELLNLQDNEIIKNIIRSKKNDNNYLDFRKLNEIINELVKIQYRDNVYNYMNNIRNITDLAQLNVITRIADMKERRKIDFKKNMISKKCPHCGHIMTMPSNTKYVVCGFTTEDDGYDWKGCQHDWCFKCGKKLCKTWGNDELNIPENRVHNIECCKNVAILNNEDYNDKYCQCHSS